MPVHRLNHAVLYVRDVERSVAFYRDVLGFRRHGLARARRSCRRPAPPTTTTSACSRSARQAGPSPAGRTTVGLYHLAWEVDTLDELERIAVKLGRGRRPRRRLRPRHHQGPVRQGPRRPGVRGVLAGPGRPAHRRRAQRAQPASSPSTSPRRRRATARRPAAASASRFPPDAPAEHSPRANAEDITGKIRERALLGAMSEKRSLGGAMERVDPKAEGFPSGPSPDHGLPAHPDVPPARATPGDTLTFYDPRFVDLPSSR